MVVELTLVLSALILFGQNILFDSESESLAAVDQTVPIFLIQRNAIENGNESVDARIQRLKDLDLWEIEPESKIPPVVFAGYPVGFNQQRRDLQTDKKIFLHTLLPIALVALREVELERTRLLEIIEKIGQSSECLIFSDTQYGMQSDWRSHLTPDETDFVFALAKKYRAKKANVLINRIDVVPVSLILGQGAIESSWGRSRFAHQGNNLFGVWTWGKEGIIPADRADGKNHKIKIYSSILDSVRGYILTLNRLKAYKELREIRQQTSDALTLAEGLLRYSERGEAYVEDVQRVISVNHLQMYDNHTLAAEPQEQGDLDKYLAFAKSVI